MGVPITTKVHKVFIVLSHSLNEICAMVCSRKNINHWGFPLKIKIFLCFKRGVLLTKDNLAKRNWNGDMSCCFCSKPKTIQHLFFECSHAMFSWRAIHMVLGINPPWNAQILFNAWYSWKNKNFFITLTDWCGGHFMVNMDNKEQS